jgi:hypothetical protein
VVSELNTTIDVTCQALGFTVRYTLRWTNLRIGADRTFTGTGSERDEDGLNWTYSITGRFTPEGPATGTLQTDVNGTYQGVLINCSTGAVGWNATPQ